MQYIYPGSLTTVLTLDSGIETAVVNAQLAGGSGVGNSQWFGVSERPGGGDRTVLLTAVPNGAVTTFTADLETSTDSGNTWQKVQTGLALIATSVSTQQKVSNLQAGAIYRLNPTTNTGGTSVTVWATAA